jgi:hypothetical protein
MGGLQSVSRPFGEETEALNTPRILWENTEEIIYVQDRNQKRSLVKTLL